MSAQTRQGRKALPYIAALVVVALLGAPRKAAAQNDQWQFGSAPSFSSGKYGTDTRTDMLYTPITARRLFADGDLTFVFPFICIWGDGSVTLVNETAVRQQPASTTRTTPSATTTTDRNGRTSITAPTASTAEPTRACGFGDIVARGRYFLVDERGWLPTVAVRAHVKVPTASAARYLGTGKADEGIGLEISRTIGGGLMAMADGGYTFIGSPAGVDYCNLWWYGIGVAQDVVKDTVNVSVFFDEDRAILPAFVNAREVLATLSVKGARGWRVQLSGEIGLSDGAPDHGVTFSASRRF